MQTECKDIIDTFGDEINECFHKGFQHFIDLHIDELNEISNRTRANYINDYVFAQLEETFEGKEGFTFIKEGVKRYIGFKNIFLIKVKKLNKSLKASFIKTQNATSFQCQEELDIFPSAKHLYLGYILNKNGIGIQRVVFVCPNLEGYDWYMDVEPTEIKQEILAFPDTLEIVQTKERIRVKKQIPKKKEISNG